MARSGRSQWAVSPVTIVVIPNAIALVLNLATSTVEVRAWWWVPTTWTALAVLVAVAVGSQILQSRAGVTDRSAAHDVSGPTQLPRDVADFTGRQIEVDRLRSLIGRTGWVVISATGQGGVGKTALALHVAHQIKEVFEGGQLYINLRGFEAPEQIRRPSDVLAEFLRALGVDPSVIPATEDERAALYRSRLAGKRMLIVLDNAADERQVRPLLPGTSDATVLITSRSRLTGLESVQSLQLNVMDTADCLNLLARLASPHRVASEPEEAASIVELCGRLPLAVRICGARLASEPGLSLSQLRTRLDDERLDEMSTGDLSVRATFAMSYHNGLTAGDQQIFRLLALIGADTFGGWVIAPLAAVAENQADAAIRKLETACLTEATGEHARFRFHDLLRVYARELLAKKDDLDKQRQAAARLVRAYRELAANALELYEPAGLRQISETATEISGPYRSELARLERDPGTWVAHEVANLVDAVRLGDQFELWDETWRLCEVLVPLLEVPSLWTEWSQINDLGLRAAHRTDDARAAPIMLQLAGELKIYTGRRDEAKVDLARSAELFGLQGLVRAQAAVLIKLGEAYRYTGYTTEALMHMMQAKELYAALDDSLGKAYALSAIGGVHRARAQWNAAVEAFRQALPVLREAGHRRQTAITLISLGDVFHLKAEWSNALECFEECGRLFHELGDIMWEANTERHAGIVDRICGRSDEALRRFETAKLLFEHIGDDRKWALTQWALGDLYADIPNLNKAMDAYQDALRVFDRIKDQFCIANVLSSAAWAQVNHGECERANAWLQRARTAAENLNQSFLLAILDLADARLRLRTGDLAGVFEAAEGSRQIFCAIGSPLWEGFALQTLGDERNRRGNAHGAQIFFRDALRLFREIEVPQSKAAETALARAIRRSRRSQTLD